MYSNILWILILQKAQTVTFTHNHAIKTIEMSMGVFFYCMQMMVQKKYLYKKIRSISFNLV